MTSSWLDGQFDNKSSTAARTRLAAHIATMALADGLDQCQPQPDATFALACAGQAVKRFKNAFALRTGAGSEQRKQISFAVQQGGHLEQDLDVGLSLRSSR